MNISKTEYKLLKKFYNSEYLIIDNDTSELLLKKGLIQHNSYGLTGTGIISFSRELEITNEGKIVYEQYNKEVHTLRRTIIQAWIAILISLGSLVVSIVSLIIN